MQDEDYIKLNNLLTETLTKKNYNFCIITFAPIDVYNYIYNFYEEDEINWNFKDVKSIILKNNNVIDVRQELSKERVNDYHTILRLGDK